MDQWLSEQQLRYSSEERYQERILKEKTECALFINNEWDETISTMKNFNDKKKYGKGETIMEKRQTIIITMVLLLLAVAALVAFDAQPAGALTECTTSAADLCASESTGDCDGDGFADNEECAPGLTLPDGTIYASCVVGADDSACSDPAVRSSNGTLSPAHPDLFVALVRPVTGSNIPDSGFDPFAFIKAPRPDGLGIAIHEVSTSQLGIGACPRCVTADQAAIKLTESLNTTGGSDLGSCSFGSPNDRDDAIIYTQRIIDHIDTVCAGATTCQDVSGVSGQDLYNLYIQRTINHEVGHTIYTVDPKNNRLKERHHLPGGDLSMERSVDYKKQQGGRKVTFHIGTIFDEVDDYPAVQLK
jgi:hypothetical protein